METPHVRYRLEKPYRDKLKRIAVELHRLGLVRHVSESAAIRWLADEGEKKIFQKKTE